MRGFCGFGWMMRLGDKYVYVALMFRTSYWVSAAGCDDLRNDVYKNEDY